jgi:hypothetical protein
MATSYDRAVPFAQAIEFYMALRRLEKPVWMLEYEDGNHGLHSDKDQKDFTLRMQQFFDHTLKGYPPPRWMTQGIPARLKGVETRYELDPEGTCSPTCPFCKKKDYTTYYKENKNIGK